MNVRRGISSGLFAAGAAAALVGCAAKKVPLVMDPRLQTVQTITLLPIVDARRDRSTQIDLDGTVGKAVREDLQLKGYQVVTAPAFSDGDSVSMEEVAEMDASELARLGPADARALMVVSLNDVFTRYVVMAYTFKADVGGLLVEKESGAVLWKDKGVISGGQGGLISGLLAAAGSEGDFAAQATRTMLQSLPECGRVP